MAGPVVVDRRPALNRTAAVLLTPTPSLNVRGSAFKLLREPHLVELFVVRPSPKYCRGQLGKNLRDAEEERSRGLFTES